MFPNFVKMLQINNILRFKTHCNEIRDFFDFSENCLLTQDQASEHSSCCFKHKTSKSH